jgi:hypothetical protein
MKTYNYDRENSEKVYEYMKYKRAQYTLGKFPHFINIKFIGGVCGVAAAWAAKPIQKHMELLNPLFRKPWFKIPIYAFAFGCAFYGGIQLPGRIFPKFTPSLN